MSAPITEEGAEAIIHHYMCLRWQLLHGQIPKLAYFLKIRAEELGMSLRSAFNLVRWARNIGWVDCKIYPKRY